MREILVLAAGLIPLVGLHAQKPQDAAKQSLSKAAKLHSQLTGEYKAASKAYSAAIRAAQQTDAYKKAREARDREAMRAVMADVESMDTASFIKKFQDAAAMFQGTDDAVDFLSWLSLNARSDTTAQRDAIDTIVGEHLGSGKLVKFAEMIPYITRAHDDLNPRTLLDVLLEDNKHAMVRAYAYNSRAMMINRARDASAEDKALAAEDLENAKELAKGTLLGLRLEGPEFVKNNLQIGMTAPDIKGVDMDGVEFKLSDYRGKVVVLDFWGDW